MTQQNKFLKGCGKKRVPDVMGTPNQINCSKNAYCKFCLIRASQRLADCKEFYKSLQLMMYFVNQVGEKKLQKILNEISDEISELEAHQKSWCKGGIS